MCEGSHQTLSPRSGATVVSSASQASYSILLAGCNALEWGTWKGLPLWLACRDKWGLPLLTSSADCSRIRERPALPSKGALSSLLMPLCVRENLWCAGEAGADEAAESSPWSAGVMVKSTQVGGFLREEDMKNEELFPEWWAGM